MKYLKNIMLLLLASCSSEVMVNEPVSNIDPINEKQFYKGTTMGFVRHQETYAGVVFKENGMPKDPFVSVFDHGGNMVRFRIDLPPYSNTYTEGYPDVDFRSPSNVKLGMQRAKNAGLNTLLTFSYRSMALDPEEQLNAYVAPLTWQTITNDFSKLKDSVYEHTYEILEDYINSGIVPKIVSIGNETNGRFLEQNTIEDNLRTYSASRTVALLNSGSKAVRDLNEKYTLDIQIACHIFGASYLKWWMGKHMPEGLDFDIMALSHYHDWHDLGDFNNWSEVIKWIKNLYNKDFLMLETAQLFTIGGNDNHVDILGTNNIPLEYENPPTTNTQRLYLKDFAQEIYNAGGLGLITWGGEWIGSTCLIYPDQWGAGSSWENKAFWDFNHNLHDGINWMQDLDILSISKK